MLIFDDKFITVFHDGKTSEELDKIFAELCVDSKEPFIKDEYDEDGILIYKWQPLDKVWMSQPKTGTSQGIEGATRLCYTPKCH